MDRPPQQPGSPADAVPSTDDIRDVYLRGRHGAASATSVPSRPKRRLAIAAGLALLCVSALLVGWSRYAPSMPAVTYDTAVERLASTVSAALELIGHTPAAPVTTEAVASISTKKVPTRPATETRRPISSSREFQLLPLVSAETAQAIEPAAMDDADVLNEDDAAIDGSMIYSPEDADVDPPVAIRSPGLAGNEVNGVEGSSVIEILVSETGLVESARGWQRPATLGAALESTTALSVVKTWRFWPAQKNGQPVRYRTTMPFAQTMNPAGTRDASR